DSIARRMRSPVVDLLADLATALEGSGIPWFLFGAQAAILHGAARLTADVDVTVRLPDRVSTEDLARTLEGRRFLARVSDPAFVRRTRVMPFVHAPTGLPLDVVLAGPGLEDTFLERAGIREIDGVSIRLASAEDLLVMKMLAGRAKDVDDVAAILRANRDRIDRAYVERTFAALEDALGQSDLLPAW